MAIHTSGNGCSGNTGHMGLGMHVALDYYLRFPIRSYSHTSTLTLIIIKAVENINRLFAEARSGEQDAVGGNQPARGDVPCKGPKGRDEPRGRGD